MLKARNILLIFILNYFAILLVCCLLEIIFITNNAQEAQKQMAVAMDAYVIEQKRETANVGKNVKTIVDLLQENPLIRMN